MTALRSEIQQGGEEIRRTLDVVKIAGRGVYKSQLPIMAAALAYRTLFSLIPLLVVGLVVIGSFASDEQVEEAVNKTLAFAGLNEIVLRDDVQETPDLSPDDQAQPEPDSEQPASVEEWIQALVERVRNIPFRTMGVVGVIFLIYAALAMFMEVERTFNKVYRVHKGRGWFTKFTMYWTVLTLGAVFLLASFYVGDKFTSLVEQVSGTSGIGAGGVLVTIAGFIVTVCISTLLFVSMYTIVPNTRVSVRAALAGGIFAAILWEASKWGFTEYLRYSAGYSRMYGSVALLPLFMLWIYVTWMVVLFGLQISYTMQRWNDWRTSPTIDSDEPVVIDPMAGLSIAVEVARAFADGKQLTASELAKRCELREPVVEHLIEPMIAASVLNHIAAGEDDPDTVALARPPEKILAAELIKLVQSLAATPGGPIGTLIARVRIGAVDAAADQTLADLLDDPPSKTQ